MNYLQLKLMLLFVWTAAFFGVAHCDIGLHLSLSIQPFVYLLGLVSVMTPLLFRRFTKVGASITLISILTVYLLIKLPLSSEASIMLAAVEVAFLVIGVWLSTALANALGTLTSESQLGGAGMTVRTLADSANNIEAEMVRARRYQRPLGALLVKPGTDESPLSESLSTAARMQAIGHVLRGIARRSELVMEDAKNHRYVVLCPETDEDGMNLFKRRIDTFLADMVSGRCLSSFSSFPAEAVTFAELVAIAAERLNQQEAMTKANAAKDTQTSNRASNPTRPRFIGFRAIEPRA